MISMKKIISFLTIVALALNFTSCESLFDNLEGDKSKLSGDYLAESEAGLSRMMASVYASIPMGAFANGDKNNAIYCNSYVVNNSDPRIVGQSDELIGNDRYLQNWANSGSFYFRYTQNV